MSEIEATQKQYILMDKLGIEYNPQGVSLGEAKQLIRDKLNKPKDVTEGYSRTDTTESDATQQLGKVGHTSVSRPDTNTCIIRQSCLKAAVESLHLYGAGTFTSHEHMIDEVQKVCDKFEKWVLR